MLSVGGLFSGIGGWELGLERAGMRIAWHCEADPFCRDVLDYQWPGVPCYTDVCELRGADVEPVDVLAGGFPCQDLSYAGLGAGLDGARSGLWGEYARLVGELRPRYVLVENVTALLVRGLGRVLGDLAALGYDAEWDCIPASAFGAPHQRDRIWLVAYPDAHGPRRREQPQHDSGPVELGRRASGRHADRLRDEVADADRGGRDRRPGQQRTSRRRESQDGGREQASTGIAYAWPPEPAMDRVVDGFPGRVDQVRALGNALVPAIAGFLGQRILEWEGGLT